MKLLVQSAMIFFGTLMAAGLFALGEPSHRGPAAVSKAAPSPVVADARAPRVNAVRPQR